MWGFDEEEDLPDTAECSEKGCNGPEGKDPEGKDPEGKDPEGKDPEGKDPEGKDPEGKDPETGTVTALQKDLGSNSPLVPHAMPGYFASNSSH